MSELVDQRLDDLVVLRAATAGKKPPRAAEVAAATARFAPPELDAAAWRARVEAIHARLVERGAIDAGGAPGAAAAAAAWSRIGTRAVPWPRLVDRILPGLALGIAAGDTRAHGRLADRDAWAAAITARAAGLWRGDEPPPTLPALCDELVWHKLGLAGKAKRTPPEVRAHFVMQLFTVAATPGPPERLVRQYAALAAGAARADLRVLRDALVRRWLAANTWRANGARVGSPPAAPAAAPTPTPADDAQRALVALAAAVRAAAAAESRAVFDERNVFISAVWRALRGRPPVDRLDLDGFKRALVAAHRAGLVSLARADLVAVMDPAEVAASETASAEARYHFVVREDAREN